MRKNKIKLALILSFLMMGNSVAPSGNAYANSENHVGVIQHVYIDYEDSHEIVNYLKTEDNKLLKLNLTNLTNVPELNSGALVRVSGRRVRSELMADNIDVMTFVPQQLSPLAVEGHRTMAVFLVNFTDNTNESNTKAGIEKMGTDMNDWLQEVSYGKVSSSLDSANIYGYYTVDNPYVGNNDDCHDGMAVWSKIFEITDQDPNINPYEFTHAIAVMESPGPCSWGGMAFIGGTLSVIRGRRNLGLWMHEMGHNLGLRHSSSADCGDVSISLPLKDPPCKQGEYGDQFDSMGSASTGHYNAYQKEKIGWLDQSNILTVTNDGVYTLSRYEDNDNLPKAIKVRSNDGNPDPDEEDIDFDYWFEYRQPVGKDSFMSNSSYDTDGLLAHIQSNSILDSSFYGNRSTWQAPLQLDLTPGTNTNTPKDFRDGILPLNQTFVDPGTTGFSITPKNQTATTIDVEIRFNGGNDPLNRAPIVQNRNIKVQKDVSLAITLKGTDADNDPLVFSITKQPNHGIIIGQSPTFTYQPEVGYLGDDEFEYKANDGKLDSNTAKVTLDVQTEPAPPADDPSSDPIQVVIEPIKNIFNKNEQVMVQCQKAGGLNLYTRGQEKVASLNCPEVGAVLPINDDLSSGIYFTDDGRKIIRLK